MGVAPGRYCAARPTSQSWVTWWRSSLHGTRPERGIETGCYGAICGCCVVGICPSFWPVNTTRAWVVKASDSAGDAAHRFRTGWVVRRFRGTFGKIAMRLRFQELPEDVLLHIMHCLQTTALALTARSLFCLWRSHCLLLPAKGGGCRRPLWLAVDFDRCVAGVGVAVGSVGPRTVVLHVTNVNCVPAYARVLTTVSTPSLERLCIHATPGTAMTDVQGTSAVRRFPVKATIHNMGRVLLASGACASLRSFEFNVRQRSLSDGAFGALGATVGRMTQLVRLSVLVPMNSITVAGLRCFVDGLLGATSLLPGSEL